MRRALVGGLAVCCLWSGSACSREDDGPDAAGPGKTPARTEVVLWESAPFVAPGGDAQDLGGRILATTPTTTTLLDHDGSPIWSVQEPGDRRSSQVLVMSNEVVRLSRNDDGSTGTRLRVLDGSTGKRLWAREGLDNPRSNDDTLFATSCAGDGVACVVLALDPRTGSVTWQRPVPAVSRIDVNGTDVIATSYPEGVDRTVDPHAARTRVDVLDQSTGRPVGETWMAAAFTITDGVLIAESFTESTEDSCALTLTARTVGGDDLWTHRVTWTRPAEDLDCAQTPTVLDRTGAVELTGIPGHHELLDLQTGHVTPADGSQVVASRDGVEVRVVDGQARATDADGTSVWAGEATGQVSLVDDDTIAFDLTDADGAERTVVREIVTGEVVLELEGRFVASGDDWLMAHRDSDTGDQTAGRLVLLEWPH